MSSRGIEPEPTGDDRGAEELYQRYAARLWELAHARIGHRFGARVAAEDVVQSVFRSFYRRVDGGTLQWNGADTVWGLLVRMTLRKVGQQIRRNQAGMRNVGREAGSLDQDVSIDAVSREPSPVDVAIFAEEVEAMFEPLDQAKAAILRLSLEGYATAEVADQLKCSRWTVRRVLDRIGFRLEERLAADLGEK